MRIFGGKKSLTLLSFSAIEEPGNGFLCFGQLGYAAKGEWTFDHYSRLRNLRKVISLYFRKVPKNKRVRLKFESLEIESQLNNRGYFMCSAEKATPGELQQVEVAAVRAEIVPELYRLKPQKLSPGQKLVISDMDDTLIQSFIYNKWLKLKAMLFTRVEKRLVVTSMENLVQRLAQSDASFFYLSNSEQNLYPIIHRFLSYNTFPPGALFLKQLRKARHLLTGKKDPPGDLHKQNTAARLMKQFPGHQWWLLGDNTQNDPHIYSGLAEEFPEEIKAVVIRRVVDEPKEDKQIEQLQQKVVKGGVDFYYAENFEDLSF